MQLEGRGKYFWTGVGFLVFVLALTPFVKWITANLFHLVGVFLFVSEVSGFFIIEGLRRDSPQMHDMRDGEHYSRSDVDLVSDLEGTSAVSTSRVGMTYGGIEVTHVNTANRHLFVGPRGAMEQLPNGDFLVYAPSVPVTAEQMYALESGIAKVAEESISNAFRSGEKSRSRARFSIFNTLSRDVTADEMRAVSDTISYFTKPTAEGMRMSEKSNQAKIDMLRKLQEFARRPSLWERIRQLTVGGGGGGNADKPSGDEE